DVRNADLRVGTLWDILGHQLFISPFQMASYGIRMQIGRCVLLGHDGPFPAWSQEIDWTGAPHGFPGCVAVTEERQRHEGMLAHCLVHVKGKPGNRMRFAYG